MTDENTDEYDHDRTEYATDPEPQGEVTFATPEDPDKPWRNANQLYYQYVILRKSSPEIAEEMGCSKQTINYWREKFGIESRSLSEARTQYPRLQDLEWLRDQYESGLNQYKIADKIGCSPGAVHNAFDRHGIETRSLSEANLIRHQRENAVPKSDVPEPPTDEDTSTERTQTGDGTNRSYDGPARGIDLSWSDASDADREPWVPYREEEWLRWQYNYLDNTMSEMANVAGVSQRTILTWMDHHGIERDGGDA